MSEMKDREAFVKAARSYHEIRERVQRRGRQHAERRESARLRAMITEVIEDEVGENAVLTVNSHLGTGRSS